MLLKETLLIEVYLFGGITKRKTEADWQKRCPETRVLSYCETVSEIEWQKPRLYGLFSWPGKGFKKKSFVVGMDRIELY